MSRANCLVGKPRQAWQVAGIEAKYGVQYEQCTAMYGVRRTAILLGYIALFLDEGHVLCVTAPFHLTEHLHP